jgi:hypothetical protein
VSAILSVLVGAIVTGIIGNALVQRWQLRGWFAQQRQLGHQNELEALKQLVEDVSTAANKRLNAMRRLSGSLAPGSLGDTEALLANYRQEVSSWMSALNSFYVRITLYVDYPMTLRLEREVHMPFVEAGRSIEGLLRARDAGEPPSFSGVAPVNDKLSALQGTIFNYSRDLLKAVDARRQEIFNGRKLGYS